LENEHKGKITIGPRYFLCADCGEGGHKKGAVECKYPVEVNDE
jgi:hypothetical protein